ncbi:MAG: tRNA guanosine(34) transglycosylase Tgt [Cytophagales bacterium]|nr:MAG: tRNA guanosine(34) transglycosylase Tgt [Cytophagales bacterium]
MFFKIHKNDSQSNARTGEITTEHGVIQTPIFMPVGTNGTVKGVHFKELEHDIKAEIILGNTYHLYLRAGIKMLEGAGGLHKFNGWNKPILTDSGGYQVYSLAHARKITEEGAIFKSFLDGSKHTFTPENVMDIQRSIGADIIMAFDECTPYPCEFEYARKSMEMTHRWLVRCKNRFEQTEPKYGYEQFLFPIVQGSTYPDLRKKSAEFVANQEFKANAIGGLSVGEPAEEMYAMTDIVTQILPKDKPRYMMGVGTPANILECIALGIDMFDCVMPTRNARNGGIFTSEGMINIRNEKWKYDYSPLDENLDGFANKYSKAYLKHLLKHDEMLGCMIASVHNLQFYLWLVTEARKKIEEGTFTFWKNKMVEKVSRKL